MDQFVLLAAESSDSLGDTMSRAGLNTLMGISIVFIALIIICFIIAMFKYINRFENRNRKAPSAPEPVEVHAAEPEAEVEEDLTDDGELVAVITAAIYAYEAGQAENNYVPADVLVVRSIRRARA